MPAATEEAPRCTFREGKRRCPRPGDGDPPRCHVHVDDEELEAELESPLVGFIAGLGQQLDRRLSGSRGAFLQGLGEVLGGALGRRAEQALGERLDPEDHEEVLAYLAKLRELHAARVREAQEQRRQRQQDAGTADAGPDRETIAREVLGFGPDEKLTEKAILERKRELAKIYHPDVNNGNQRPMQRVNQAADVLIKGL